MPDQSHPAVAVFLSYASEDADAAARICEALRAAGVEVWLDKNELRGGDTWDAQIKKRIHECALFIPLISAHTNGRAEGYFRGEWYLATRRLINMAHDTAFLVPVVVDDTREDDARVPEEFFRAQWTWLPGGETAPAFAHRVRQLLGLDPVPTPAAKSAAKSATGPSIPDPGSMRPRGTPLMRRFGLPLVAMLMVLGGGYIWYYQGDSNAPTVTPELPTASPVIPVALDDKSIAVLPFVDMSAEKDQEYMSDGIAEELLNLLAQVPDLKVIARTSSFAFKGQNIEIQEIAKKLNVAHVLEGSVRTSGNKLRITVQLIRAADSTHLWSEKYDRPLSDIFEVQDEIANAIVQALQIKLMGGTLIRRQGGTQNLQAYRLYLQAGASIAEGTEKSLSAADNYLVQAIEKDPGFGNAWSRRATVVANQLASGYSNITTQRGYADYRRYIETALRWSPDNAEAHAGLAGLYILEDWDWPAAEREMERAMAIDPNNPEVLATMAGIASTFLGNQKEAMRYQRLAISRDPNDLQRVEGLGFIYYSDGQFEEAERIFRSVLELQPKRPFTYQYLTTALLAQGKANAALEALMQDPEEISRTGYLPIVLEAVGRQAEADAALEKLIEVWANEWAVAVAQVYAYRGDIDHTLEWLERAYRQKDSDMLRIIDQPLFNRVVNDPRFQAFVRDKLRIERRLSTVG